MNNVNYTQLSFGKKLGLFLCLWIFTTIISSFIVGFITYKWGMDSTPALRIATVIQDLIMFILPAIVVAMLVTRVPAEFLSINRLSKGKNYILTLLPLVISIPAMNYLIEWNSSVQLPESLIEIQQWMQASEQNAENTIKSMLGSPTIPNLIMSILIIGVLAGLSEELFFRGALQKIFQSRPMNPHVAIWITAFIFSAIHMQFYGFVPRLILGAFFGYLVLWSGSLWLPIVAHAFNNIVTVLFTWLYNRGVLNMDPNAFGANSTMFDKTIAITSVIATIIAIIYLRKKLIASNQISCGGKQNRDRDTSL